ncbi:hypothetical protein PQ472_02230 [Lacticaseibacillus pabuli]|uniref:Uncharacterized protein n=1 Tax=Lacticaseibacillus pabuli TaxID=3025672 RepID=A0ABY7WSA8_9LACO|nr:hypothetical protein [Lacticaseibacillus sp. KACC 23028]WDF83070.1 hypothetical protein PQ472_02230 [Lacticaseibacillus sp. KACC 23028]
MKNDEKKSLLDQDINHRVDEEEKLVNGPKKEKNHGRVTQMIIGIVIAIIALAGIIYPLLH